MSSSKIAPPADRPPRSNSPGIATPTFSRVPSGRLPPAIRPLPHNSAELKGLQMTSASNSGVGGNTFVSVSNAQLGQLGDHNGVATPHNASVIVSNNSNEQSFVVSNSSAVPSLNGTPRMAPRTAVVLSSPLNSTVDVKPLRGGGKGSNLTATRGPPTAPNAREGQSSPIRAPPRPPPPSRVAAEGSPLQPPAKRPSSPLATGNKAPAVSSPRAPLQRPRPASSSNLNHNTSPNSGFHVSEEATERHEVRPMDPSRLIDDAPPAAAGAHSPMYGSPLLTSMSSNNDIHNTHGNHGNSSVGFGMRSSAVQHNLLITSPADPNLGSNGNIRDNGTRTDAGRTQSFSGGAPRERPPAVPLVGSSPKISGGGVTTISRSASSHAFPPLSPSAAEGGGRTGSPNSQRLLANAEPLTTTLDTPEMSPQRAETSVFVPEVEGQGTSVTAAPPNTTTTRVGDARRKPPTSRPNSPSGPPNRSSSSVATHTSTSESAITPTAAPQPPQNNSTVAPFANMSTNTAVPTAALPTTTHPPPSSRYEGKKGVEATVKPGTNVGNEPRHFITFSLTLRGGDCARIEADGPFRNMSLERSILSECVTNSVDDPRIDSSETECSISSAQMTAIGVEGQVAVVGTDSRHRREVATVLTSWLANTALCAEAFGAALSKIEQASVEAMKSRRPPAAGKASSNLTNVDLITTNQKAASSQPFSLSVEQIFVNDVSVRPIVAGPPSTPATRRPSLATNAGPLGRESDPKILPSSISDSNHREDSRISRQNSFGSMLATINGEEAVVNVNSSHNKHSGNVRMVSNGLSSSSTRRSGSEPFAIPLNSADRLEDSDAYDSEDGQRRGPRRSNPPAPLNQRIAMKTGPAVFDRGGVQRGSSTSRSSSANQNYQDSAATTYHRPYPRPSGGAYGDYDPNLTVTSAVPTRNGGGHTPNSSAAHHHSSLVGGRERSNQEAGGRRLFDRERQSVPHSVAPRLVARADDYSAAMALAFAPTPREGKKYIDEGYHVQQAKVNTSSSLGMSYSSRQEESRMSRHSIYSDAVYAHEIPPQGRGPRGERRGRAEEDDDDEQRQYVYRSQRPRSPPRAAHKDPYYRDHEYVYETRVRQPHSSVLPAHYEKRHLEAPLMTTPPYPQPGYQHEDYNRPRTQLYPPSEGYPSYRHEQPTRGVVLAPSPGPSSRYANASASFYGSPHAGRGRRPTHTPPVSSSENNMYPPVPNAQREPGGFVNSNVHTWRAMDASYARHAAGGLSTPQPTHYYNPDYEGLNSEPGDAFPTGRYALHATRGEMF